MLHLESPPFCSYPRTWTVNSRPSIGYRYEDIRVVPPTFARLAIHDLVHGRTTYVIRSSCDSSTNWSIGMSSSTTEGTLSTEDTEATLFWMRAGLCRCGRCEPHWFQYGWQCWGSNSADKAKGKSRGRPVNTASSSQVTYDV